MFILDHIWTWSLVLLSGKLSGRWCVLVVPAPSPPTAPLSAGVGVFCRLNACGMFIGLNALGLLPSAKQSIRGGQDML